MPAADAGAQALACGGEGAEGGLLEHFDNIERPSNLHFEYVYLQKSLARLLTHEEAEERKDKDHRMSWSNF